MKINRNTKIPDIYAYVALYVIIFGISIWILIVDAESPNNWILYAAMIASVLAGLVKLAVDRGKRSHRSM